VFGSSANGLTTSSNSDLDLSLIIHDIYDSSRSKFEGQVFLGIKDIKKILLVIREYLQEQKFSVEGEANF
jgi:DNA polymerase sigma